MCILIPVAAKTTKPKSATKKNVKAAKAKTPKGKAAA